jgi:hypothetical protein
VSRTAMTSRKFSSDCGAIEGPHIARSVYQTFAATPRSMTALEVVQKSMIYIFGAWWWQSPNFIGRKIRAIQRDRRMSERTRRCYRATEAHTASAPIERG